jgi:hypothetical protein
MDNCIRFEFSSLVKQPNSNELALAPPTRVFDQQRDPVPLNYNQPIRAVPRPEVASMSTILEVGPTEFVVGPTSLSAITLASDPDRYRSGFIALRKLTAGRSTTRTNQLAHVGSQGGPLSQGCVANASTAGARMQARPSTLRASEVVVAVA